MSFKKSFFVPSSDHFEAAFPVFQQFVMFFISFFIFPFFCFFLKYVFHFSKLLPLLAFVIGFYKRCFLCSRCSMEMWCPDDLERDSWDWAGPLAWERA